MIFPEVKLLTSEQLQMWRKDLCAHGRKLVLTNGCFDILHRGHVSYLYQARAQGDALIVLMNSDASVRLLKGPLRPVNTQSDRAYVLGGLACVDAVFIFSEPQCTKWLEFIAPDIYVKGADYTLDTLNPEERHAIERVGAEVVFIDFVQGYSTTHLISKTQTTS